MPVLFRGYVARIQVGLVELCIQVSLKTLVCLGAFFALSSEFVLAILLFCTHVW